MAQQLLVVVVPQHVEHEAIAHLHQGLDGPVLGHRHRDAGGSKLAWATQLATMALLRAVALAVALARPVEPPSAPVSSWRAVTT